MKSFDDFMNEGNRGFTDIERWEEAIEQALVDVIRDEEMEKDDQQILTGIVDDILMEVKSRKIDHDDLSVGEFQRIFLQAAREAGVHGISAQSTGLTRLLHEFFRKVKRSVAD
jgi:hypothetical protein